MEFAFIISHDRDFSPTETLLAAIAEWIDMQTRAGVRIHGRPLAPPDVAYTVRVRDGRISKTAGAAVDLAEQICAYELYCCPSIEEAVELATLHPMAAVATIEVRPVWVERLRV